MSEHVAEVIWKRQTEGFKYQDYNREHIWRFDNGIEVAASATPEYLGKPDFVDPEEAYVASLSSCHMLTFLAIAARKRFVVNSYSDRAVGLMKANADGKLAITTVHLHPMVEFEGDKQPNAEELESLHHFAHDECFIANSVLTKVVVAS